MDVIIYKTLALTLLSYILTLVLTRFMGRKSISQITFFDFVVGITMGSVAANLLISNENPVISSIVGLIAISLLVLLFDLTHMKSLHLLKLFDSEPVVVIENGKILETNMRRTRMALTELMQLLREKNIFNISDVEYALLETDGKLSVLPKSQKQPVTPSDLHIPTNYKGLTKDIILDGVIMEENLSETKLDKEWLYNELKTYNVNNVKQVFYAGLDTLGNLYVSLKQAGSEQPGEHGIE